MIRLKDGVVSSANFLKGSQGELDPKRLTEKGRWRMTGNDLGVHLIGVAIMYLALQLFVYPAIAKRWRAVDKQALGGCFDATIKALFVGGIILVALYACAHGHHNGCFNPRYDDCE
jgi:hypothetical protein